MANPKGVGLPILIKEGPKAYPKLGILPLLAFLDRQLSLPLRLRFPNSYPPINSAASFNICNIFPGQIARYILLTR